MTRKYYTVFLKAGIHGPTREYVNSFAGNFTTGADPIAYCVATFPEFEADDFEAEELSKAAWDGEWNPESSFNEGV